MHIDKNGIQIYYLTTARARSLIMEVPMDIPREVEKLYTLDTSTPTGFWSDSATNGGLQRRRPYSTRHTRS